MGVPSVNPQNNNNDLFPLEEVVINIEGQTLGTSLY